MFGEQTYAQLRTCFTWIQSFSPALPLINLPGVSQRLWEITLLWHPTNCSVFSKKKKKKKKSHINQFLMNPWWKYHHIMSFFLLLLANKATYRSLFSSYHECAILQSWHLQWSWMSLIQTWGMIGMSFLLKILVGLTLPRISWGQY